MIILSSYGTPVESKIYFNQNKNQKMVVIEILSIIGAVTLARIITFILTPAENVEPIFGIYKRPGKWYWAKYLAMYFILKSRKVSGYSK